MATAIDVSALRVVAKPAAEVQQRPEHLPLWSVLEKLGLEPFASEAIELHKETELEKANKGVWRDRLLMWVWNAKENNGLVEIWLIYFACVAFGLIQPSEPIPALFYWGVFAIGLASLAFGSVLYLTCKWLYGRELRTGQAEWRTSDSAFDIRQSFAPAWVVELFQKVRVAQPSVTCRIHMLVQGKMKLDPILEVVLGKESYFIAVWRADDSNAGEEVRRLRA
jgi:hypothetical protein